MKKKKSSLLVFSRRNSSEVEEKDVRVIRVNYNDHQQLVQALENVHTVISCIADLDESCRGAQIALLNASYADAIIQFAQGEVEYPATLNQRFPQLKLTRIDEFIEKWWDGKQGLIF